MNMNFKATLRNVGIFGLTLAIALLGQPVLAQDYLSSIVRKLADGSPITRGATDDTPVTFLIRYTGTNANGGTVTVAANGDITLSQGSVGASAVDTTVECDGSITTSGSRSGIIDVSDAACDTLGEVVDIINSQTTNWRIVILDGLRSYSSNDTLLARSETAANAVGGLGLLSDTDVALHTTLLVAPPTIALQGQPVNYGPRDIRFYLGGVDNRQYTTLTPNPFRGVRYKLWQANATSTYGSGTSNWSLTCSLLTQSAATTGGTESVDSYTVPGGATTVNKVFDFSAYGYDCPPGWRMLSRLVNSAAMASTQHYVAGLQY